MPDNVADFVEELDNSIYVPDEAVKVTSCPYTVRGYFVLVLSDGTVITINTSIRNAVVTSSAGNLFRDNACPQN